MYKRQAFTPSSVSLGHWAIGGVLPDYRKVGGEMAMESVRMDTHPQDTAKHLSVIGCKAVLDLSLIHILQRSKFQPCLLRYDRDRGYQLYSPSKSRIKQSIYLNKLGCALDTFLLNRVY